MLQEALRFAVPLHITEVKDLPFRERYRLAAQAADAVASQGDTLLYGSKSTRFGNGARELARHQAHGDAKTGECATCTKRDDQPHCCMRRFHSRCGTCLRGQVTYSAGEVFNFLARGLAIAACQPGGVTWAGMHWCAWPHPRCPDQRTPRKPPCCTCAGGGCPDIPSEGGCEDCAFCVNGCLAATRTSRRCCCRTPPESPAPGPPLVNVPTGSFL